MKRACSNNKSKQTEKRICREPATICILHDYEDFNDCDKFTPLIATKMQKCQKCQKCEEKLHQLQDIRDKKKHRN